MPYILEGVSAQVDGIPLDATEKAAIDYGMPLGHLELADTVGLDICLHIDKILSGTVGLKIPTTLDSEVESGQVGKKRTRTLPMER